MKTIIYDPKGPSVRDHDVASEVDKIFTLDGDSEHRYGTHLVIEEVRARISEGAVNLQDVTLQVINKAGQLCEKTVNKYGASSDWCDTEYVFNEILARILKF